MPRPSARRAHLGQHDDVARGHAAARDIGQRLGGHRDDMQLRGHRVTQRGGQHRRAAQALGELVVGAEKPAALACRQHDHRRLRVHAPPSFLFVVDDTDRSRAVEAEWDPHPESGSGTYT
jgi:hypothetical protein